MVMKKLPFLLVIFALIANAETVLRSRPRYILHPGDVLELNYRLSPEYNQAVTLEPDGHVSLNLAGDVMLGGLTLEQAKGRILQLVSLRLNEPELNLVLKDFQKPYVVVGGEVNSPGKIEIREDMTAIQAMMLAGGPKTSGRTNKIALFRHLNGDSGEVKILDLSNLKRTGDLERDIRLEPGDMLFITTSRTEKFERFMKAANFGLFLNPLAF